MSNAAFPLNSYAKSAHRTTTYLNRAVRLCCALVVGITAFSCNTLQPFYGKAYRDWQDYTMPDSSRLEHTVYLVGDGGDMSSEDDLIKVLHNSLMNEADSASSVVFLGDNIYLHGLPEEGATDRQEKEAVIRAQMDAAAGYNGNVIFIPGNHDWDYSGPDGLERIIYQERFVEEYFDGADVFMPDNGCPGPDLVRVNENVVLIVLDSEWWVHPYEVPQAPENGCTTVDKTDFMVRLDAMVRANDDKHVLIVAHHPVISNGNHGGHYNIVDHIFPLRLVRDNLYIPLPVIGSIYPVARKLGVSPQDIPNTEFQTYKNGLMAIIEQRPNVVYATGHDHNLQLNEQGEMHHIISGSSSKTAFAIRGFGADYVHQQKGFARVMYFDDGEAWVEYFIVNDENPDGLLSFRKPLYALENETVAEEVSPEMQEDSIYQAPASSWSRRNFPGKLLFGNGRINEWTTPVTVPVFNPALFDGGIEVLTKSGARNSLSLSVRGNSGRTYLIRPVEKYAVRGLSSGFLDTWLADGVSEQNRANHPFGDLVIGSLASDVGYSQAVPELYYIPVSPVFGQYMDEFGGSIATVERALPENNPENESPYASILTTRSMIRRIEEDPGIRPDAQAYLKERIFDLWSGNFSRDRNDWQWIPLKMDSAWTIVPVSLERPDLFPKYDGLVSWLRSRSWNNDRIVSFSDTIRDIRPFLHISAGLDQRILSELTWQDWEEVLSEMNYQIDSMSIRSAVDQLPEELREQESEILAKQLMARWQDMGDYLRSFYLELNERISLNGTNGDDFFSLMSSGGDKVELMLRSGSDNKLIYSRLIDPSETREIRMYGLDGNDEFRFDKVPQGMEIRIMPGPGDDQLSGRITAGDVHLYEKDEYTETSELNVRRHNSYWPDTYWADVDNDQKGGITPAVSLRVNPDDGLLAGAVIDFRKSGFRRSPWSVAGNVKAYYATATDAFTAKLNASFYSLFGERNDLTVQASFSDPYVINYFGEGNNTVNAFSIDYYRIPIRTGMIDIGLQRRFSEALTIGISGGYSGYSVGQPDPGESITGELPPDVFNFPSPADFARLGLQLDLEVLDQPYNPEKGFAFSTGARWNRELHNGTGDFVHSYARLSLFVTPNLPVRVTFASRVGYEVNSGDYYFYQSAFLDGLTNLRGYRRTRFAGKSMLFINNEIRIKVIPFRNDLIHGTAGLIGFFDQGKVWDRERVSGKFHTGYGPGLYVQLMDRIIWRASYGISSEDNYFVLSTGFFF